MLDVAITQELADLRPPASPFRLSRPERERLVQRSFHALYRWYMDRSQRTRNWNPDTSFDWRAYRRTHSPTVLQVLEGFYAVEQYAPDYTYELIRLTRRGYGRSQFVLRWGSEEEKHADLWRNTLLHSGQRTPEWIEAYTEELRARAWLLNWDETIRNILYTVIQERATQLNYLNLAALARGEGKAGFEADHDPELARMAQTIAVDEAAHFAFFLAGAQLFLYYFPEETCEALLDVLKLFQMPAANLVPDYEAFTASLHEADLFGRRKYARDVVRVALDALGVESIAALEAGVHERRSVPQMDGTLRSTQANFGVRFDVIESSLDGIFRRIGAFEHRAGLTDVAPTRFQRVVW